MLRSLLCAQITLTHLENFTWLFICATILLETVWPWNELTGYHWNKRFIKKYFSKAFLFDQFDFGHSCQVPTALKAVKGNCHVHFVEILLVEHTRTILWPRVACWHAQYGALCASIHCVSFCGNSFTVIIKKYQNFNKTILTLVDRLKLLGRVQW